MSVRWNLTADVAIQQLLELSCCSNAKLHSAGVKLGLIDANEVKKDSFHFHVDKQGWRQQVVTHYKRLKLGDGSAPDLSGCRLGSSARVQFSMRLIPISFFMREPKERDSGPVPDAKQIPVFGVLGVVQELCSGLLRAELLLQDCATQTGIYALPEDRLIDFVARSISLPALKCAAIHFPKIKFDSDVTRPKAAGLIGAWLGVPQPGGAETTLEGAFKKFSEKVIKKARWGSASHKIRPEASLFQMDFPPQQESTMLDLKKPCGKGWAIHTLTRQLRERLDHHNTVIDADAGDLSPALRLWIARLCYYPADRDDEAKQRDALEAMIRSICYRTRISSREIVSLQDVGIRHLSVNTYPTTK